MTRMAPEEAAQVACQDRLSLAVTAPKKWTESSPGFVKLPRIHAISTSQSVAHETSASGVDPTIYAYDSLYDSIKSATQVKKSQDVADAAERRPTTERLNVGPSVPNSSVQTGTGTCVKNAQVHSGAETECKNSHGLSGLYRNLLNRTEAQHDATSDLTVASTTDSDTTSSTPKIPLRPGIEVNDEGQVVDKRQLLSTGLNVMLEWVVEDTVPARWNRARQTMMLEMQLEESGKRAMGEGEEKRREMVGRQVKRGKTGEEVESAKERYLRRKREREEAEKRKKEPDGGGVG
ncbi:hypothetical protein BDZ91DRAFT_786707 [Kalaharituber pfeilii]|nr:hypothetical protein BDZ91DRAFT_786707 [Kalaharituber pfeilii]